MRARFVIACVLATVLASGLSVFAMTQHGGWIFEENGNVSCQAWIEWADTDRLVQVWIRDPSGQIIATHWDSAIYPYERALAYASVSPTGSGTYTCEAEFSELTQPDEYDWQSYNLEVQ